MSGRRLEPGTALAAGTVAGVAVMVALGAAVVVIVGGPGSTAYAGFAVGALAAAVVFCAFTARAGVGGLLTGLAAIALAAVLGSAAIPQRIDSERELREVRFGHPVGFVAAEPWRYDPVAYPVTVALDPWEDVARLEPVRFAVSYTLVYAPLLAVAMLSRRRRQEP
jgi:hypothetical protein